MKRISRRDQSQRLLINMQQRKEPKICVLEATVTRGNGGLHEKNQPKNFFRLRPDFEMNAEISLVGSVLSLVVIDSAN